MTPDEYCQKFRDWLDIVMKHGEFSKDQRDGFAGTAFAISKSCLLHRTVYLGEGISQTPCPVHKGRWSGIDFMGRNAEAIERGCRCYKHKCGCTTGWQPDEHCGCV